MYNYISLVFILSLVFSSCVQDLPETGDLNYETIIDDEKMLLGDVNRKGFELDDYKNWFDSTYQAYPVKRELLQSLESGLDRIEIKTFLATWCSDSREVVPALFKILDESNFNEENLSMVAIDRTKKLPKESLEEYDIEFVPTIILLKDNKELGRIVETPNLSIEEDILNIIDM